MTSRKEHVSEMLHVVANSSTFRGSRAINEDHYLALVGDQSPCGTLGLLTLADGIGGLGTGATASALAVKTVADVFAASCAIASSMVSDVPHLLRYAVQKSNAMVFQTQLDDKNLHGMGTTCVAAALTYDALHVISIGDSRAYLLHEGELTQLTEDEWIKRDGGITEVNRAIGWQPILPVEPISYPLYEGDTVLLCSDGLTDVVSNDAIREALISDSSGNACLNLAESIAESPDSDNIAIIVATVVRS